MWMVFKKDTGNLAGLMRVCRIPGSSEVELLYGLCRVAGDKAWRQKRRERMSSGCSQLKTLTV